MHTETGEQRHPTHSKLPGRSALWCITVMTCPQEMKLTTHKHTVLKKVANYIDQRKNAQFQTGDTIARSTASYRPKWLSHQQVTLKKSTCKQNYIYWPLPRMKKAGTPELLCQLRSQTPWNPNPWPRPSLLPFLSVALLWGQEPALPGDTHKTQPWTSQGHCSETPAPPAQHREPPRPQRENVHHTISTFRASAP